MNFVKCIESFNILVLLSSKSKNQSEIIPLFWAFSEDFICFQSSEMFPAKSFIIKLPLLFCEKLSFFFWKSGSDFIVFHVFFRVFDRFLKSKNSSWHKVGFFI